MADLTADIGLALDAARLFRLMAGVAASGWQADYLRQRPGRALLRCGRQVGKSTVVAVDAAHTALFVPESVTLVVSPTERQSKELVRKVRLGFARLGVRGALTTDATTMLTLPNGSRIMALPGASPDQIRGLTCDLLILDEASRVADDMLGAARPMLAARPGARLVALSTPAGRRGWWYEAWKSNEPWARWHVPSSDCPHIAAEFLEEERRTMTGEYYRQEYEAAWVDERGSVFASTDIAAALDPTLQPLTARFAAMGLHR